MGIIGQQFLKIVLNISKDAKDVRSLVIFKGHLHRLCILLLNLGRFGDGLLISLAKFILHQAKGISLFLLPQIISPSGVEAIPLKKVTSANMIDFVKEYIVYRFGIP